MTDPLEQLKAMMAAQASQPAESDEDKVGYLCQVGRKHQVQPQDRLSGSAAPMSKPLQDFFNEILDELGDAKARRRFSLQNMADALDRLGVASSSGRQVQASHVSNAVRKSIKKIGPAYPKEGYKGRNHHTYGSGEAPLKTDYASRGR